MDAPHMYEYLEDEFFEEYEDDEEFDDYEDDFETKPWKEMSLREKIGMVMGSAGFVGFLFFASAVDGPGNDMRLVYGGLIISIALLFFGGIIGEYMQ